MKRHSVLVGFPIPTVKDSIRWRNWTRALEIVWKKSHGLSFGSSPVAITVVVHGVETAPVALYDDILLAMKITGIVRESPIVSVTMSIGDKDEDRIAEITVEKVRKRGPKSSRQRKEYLAGAVVEGS